MTERPTARHGKSDEELITEFQNGDEAAFTQLVGRYKDQLINYIYRYVGDSDEADDILQEVFVRVYHKKNTYRPIAKFSTWIYTIAANLCKTELRRRGRHFFLSLSKTRGGADDKYPEIPDSRYLSDHEAERSSDHEMIQDALMKLPPKYREVIILSDLQDLTYEEISDITGLNIGTVKSRLNRGRLKLQKLLKDFI